jgi:hypothetical protein
VPRGRLLARLDRNFIVTDDTAVTPRVPFYRNPDYLLLVSAQGLSLTGREIESLVMPLLVLGLTGSPVQAGFIAACQSVPYFVLSLLAGALVDRWDRKWVMLICDAVRVVAFGSIPIAWMTGALHIAQLYVVALAAGSAFVFYNIAEISALPLVVGKDELTRATSSNTVIEWIGENAGPALGGVLIGLRKSTAAGAVLAYTVQAGILFASLFFLAGIAKPLRAPPSEMPRRPLLAEVREGVVWLFAHREIRAMAFLAAALAVLFGPVQLAIIVLARQDFHAQPATIGLLFSTGGVAGILTTLTAPRFRRWFSAGTIIVYGTFFWVLGLAGMAMAGSVLVLGAGWAILTGVSGIRDVVSISYRLSLIPAEMQGRVNSVFRFVAWGLRPASLAFGGYAIGTFGPRPTLWVMTAGMVIAAVAAAFSPLRKAQ